MSAADIDGIFGHDGMVLEALEFARRRHSFDRYGGKPYEVHLFAVEKILTDSGFDRPLWRAAAFLHDTIEDTGTTRGEIEERFDARNQHPGPYVSDLVWACTGIGANRATRQADIRRKIALCPDAAPLKVADRIANVEAAIAPLTFASLYLAGADDFEQIAVRAPLSMINRLDRGYAALRRALGYGPSAMSAHGPLGPRVEAGTFDEFSAAAKSYMRTVAGAVAGRKETP